MKSSSRRSNLEKDSSIAQPLTFEETFDGWGTSQYHEIQESNTYPCATLNPILNMSESKPLLETLASKWMPIPQRHVNHVDTNNNKTQFNQKICNPKWSRVKKTVSTNDHKPKMIRYTAYSLNFLSALFTSEFSFLKTHYVIYFVLAWTLLATVFAMIFIYTGYGASLQTDKIIRIQANVQLLISFVLAGYVSNCLSRWDKMVTTTLGGACNLMEGMLSSLQHQLLVSKQSGNPAVRSLFDLLVRYLRLLIKLVFLAAQDDQDMTPLVEAGLLTAEEKTKLCVVDIDSRPLAVLVWLGGYFRGLKAIDLDVNLNDLYYQLPLLRANILDLMRVVRTPYPYSYVHLVHWIAQLMFIYLAYETGVLVGSKYFNKDRFDVPNPVVYFVYSSFDSYLANLLYCVFVDGLLGVVDKLHNPLSHNCSSVSESLIGMLREVYTLILVVLIYYLYLF